ncbi:macrolide ABC transporter permease [Longibacter salinarum]|uniref:Macrolide ABC transporter permease n=1 Tax=Longibacter salinarum TaxID=1850348 RepID=A0A2A8CUJ4_9BACT|nr:ABC transporter permease [Longibacter salinarum]PEN11198.1 macrolide ABC transporter permease [Longibacter salinarum]
MLRNYFKTALRALRRHAGYTLLNTVGIAVGMAACLLIGLYVQSEWTYDSFHDASDRIYRVWVDETYEDRQFTNTITPLPLGPTLEARYPEVEKAVRIFVREDVVQRDDTGFREQIHAVDRGFFDVFDFPFLKGDPATALDSPDGVVLTDRVAKTYFGDADPLGRTLQIRGGDGFETFTVTGIAAEPPVESSIQFNILTPLRDANFGERSRTAWFRVFVETYVLLRDNADPDALRAKLPEMVVDAIGPEEAAASQYTVGLQPITSIHLDTSLPAGLEPTSRPLYSIVLAALGLLILGIACINFVTLAVGRSAERAREVGVRKVVGADRRQLMQQFWGEAFLVTGAALALSLGLAWVGLPVFETLAGRDLAFDLSGSILLLMAGLMILVGGVAGGYPAAVLSGLHPTDVLKGRLPIRPRSRLQRVLVGTQFVCSTVLLVTLFVMNQQIGYVESAPLGYQTEQIVTIPTTGSFDEGMATLDRMRGELSGVPGIVDVAASSYTPGQPWITAELEDDRGGFYTYRANLVSYDYIETMGIDITEGRSFNRDMPSDTSRGIVVNEALVDAMGWTDAVGRRLPGMSDHEIVGVTDNFHYASLHETVEPVVLTANPDLIFRSAVNIGVPGSTAPKIAVRIASGNVQRAMTAIEEAWETTSAGQPFAYTFLDDAVDQQYRQERRFAKIVGWTTALAVGIAMFGLFALVVLITQHRRREIGIRRVLGASATSIVGLLSSEFVKVVAVAFVVATPIAYLLVRRWLQDFAYHVDLSALPFVLAAGLILLLTLATVGAQAVRSAHRDPVAVLRRE